MFTCVKIRFNQLAFLIARLCNLYTSEISPPAGIISWCKSDIQCDNYNMKRSSNTTTLSDYGFQKKRKNEHGRTSMLLKSTQFMLISETPHGHGQQKRKQPHIF